ncbi:MAG: endonuclease/exonuclease/phosphatase family protein [Hyphomicrobiales bacterium]
MLTLLKAALWLACLGLWAATLAGMTAPFIPAFELFNHFRLFLVTGALVLSLAVWIVRSRALRLTAIAGLALNLALGAVPFLYSAPKAVDASAPHLRLMTMNIWGRNNDIDRMRDEILKQQPDVIVFQEFRPYHQPLLDALRATMPHQHTCMQIPRCDLAMASRLPWTEVGSIGEGEQGGNPPVIWADFATMGKRPFRIYGVHLGWPFDPIDQAANIDWLIDYLPRTKGAYVIAGDFNLSPWSWKLSKLTAEALWPAPACDLGTLLADAPAVPIRPHRQCVGDSGLHHDLCARRRPRRLRPRAVGGRSGFELNCELTLARQLIGAHLGSSTASGLAYMMKLGLKRNKHPLIVPRKVRGYGPNDGSETGRSAQIVGMPNCLSLRATGLLPIFPVPPAMRNTNSRAKRESLARKLLTEHSTRNASA